MNGVAQRIALAFALLCLPAAAQAQPFPAGPISVVVPLAPGDAADISVRAMGEEISRLLNTSVVVINRPGAGGAEQSLMTGCQAPHPPAHRAAA